MTTPDPHLRSNGHAVEAEGLATKLGPLPNRLVYYDGFLRTSRLLTGLEAEQDWRLLADGQSITFTFGAFPEHARTLLKHWVLRELHRSKATSAYAKVTGLRAAVSALGTELLTRVLRDHPMEVRAYWYARIYPGLTASAAGGVKSLIHFCCAEGLGQWNPQHGDFVHRFTLPTQDVYASVRSGDAFLTLREEALIFDYLADVAHKARHDRASGCPVKALRDAGLLALGTQWGLRPLTLALVRDQDVRLSVDTDGTYSAVFTFEAVKRPGESIVETATRACRAEWAPIFHAYAARRDLPGERGSKSLADHTITPGSFFRASPNAIGASIVNLTRTLLPRSRSATDLRHLGAQRLADAGASLEDIGRYLLHVEGSDVGLIYIDQSPTQASKLNRALALSPIYTAIVEISKSRIIDKSKLPGLAPDHQVGGCPHGVPIAGIGACEIGQSLCARNPVLSCYACTKFMPVSDVGLHKEVRESLRGIVLDTFHSALEDSTQHPAFAQLQRTIGAVEATIAAIEDPGDS